MKYRAWGWNVIEIDGQSIPQIREALRKANEPTDAPTLIIGKTVMGLGAVAAAKNSAGEAFRGQFVGMSGQLAVTKDGGEVDALTGATITSRAICQGINAALACAKEMG